MFKNIRLEVFQMFHSISHCLCKIQIWIQNSKFPFSNIKSEPSLFIISVVCFVSLLTLQPWAVAFSISPFPQDFWQQHGAITVITNLKPPTQKKNWLITKTCHLSPKLALVQLSKSNSHWNRNAATDTTYALLFYVDACFVSRPSLPSF